MWLCLNDKNLALDFIFGLGICKISSLKPTTPPFLLPEAVNCILENLYQAITLQHSNCAH